MNISKIKHIIIASGITIFCMLIILMVLSAAPSYRVLIKDNNSNFFKAQSICIIGNTMLCRKDASIFTRRDEALKNKQENYSFTALSVKDLVFIEIIPEIVESETINGIYLGMYLVKVTGHVGYLYLLAKDNIMYGSIQFPQWGNGVAEPLKNIYFLNGKISFTRSVINASELRQVGANNYFVQQYSGEYSQDGTYIKGFYIKDGARLLWEAQRIK